MRTLATILILSTASFALFAQSVNANFRSDEQGWMPRFAGYSPNAEGCDRCIEWSIIMPPFEDKNGLSFYGKNCGTELFLYIQKEVDGLSPNTNYRLFFNTDWIYQMDSTASPVFVKAGAVAQEPEHFGIDVMKPSFRRGDIGQNGRDISVIGQLTPDRDRENLQNFEDPFFANTDENGRLFLMLGVESESGIFENIFLNTLRIVLAENGAAREVPNVDTPEVSVPIVFHSNETNDTIFFESDYNDDIEMLNIYTQDNHLIKVYMFRNPDDTRAFRVEGLESDTYRIEFVLADGRTINKLYTIE